MDYNIPGYSIHPVNLDNKIGRGLAVYSKDELDKSVIQVDGDSSFEEICPLEIRLHGGDLLLFGCVYRSPTISESSELNNEKLNELLKSIATKQYTHRCIVGDFNFKKINWTSWSAQSGENSVELKFIEAARDSFLHQYVEKPTRRRGNDDPSLLYLIFTDESMQVSEIAHYAPLGKSDHSVITFDFHCYLDFTTQKDKYSFDKGDYESMRSELINSKWKEDYTKIDSDASVEDKWASLKAMLSKLRDIYVPKQKSTGKPRWKERGSFPMCSETCDAMKEKNKVFRSWMTSKSNLQRDAARLKYNKLRNKTKTLLRKSKRYFEKGIAQRFKNNPKSFWTHTRRKLKTNCSVAPLLKDLKNKSSLKFKDKEKANILQKKFSSIFTKEPEGTIPTIDKRTNSLLQDISITVEMARLHSLKTECEQIMWSR